MMKNGHSAKGERAERIMDALRRSEERTRKYFAGSMVFYAVVIAALSALALTASEPKARNAYIGFIILSYLGFNGLWISALRGLRGTGISVGGFLNLFRFPIALARRELESKEGSMDEEDRMRSALELLRRQAAAEKEHRAWPNRALSLAVITAVDLVVWLVLHNPVMALVNQLIATAVSQTHITIGPKTSLEALEEFTAD
jgi:hypothetical protein